MRKRLFRHHKRAHLRMSLEVIDPAAQQMIVQNHVGIDHKQIIGARLARRFYRLDPGHAAFAVRQFQQRNGIGSGGRLAADDRNRIVRGAVIGDKNLQAGVVLAHTACPDTPPHWRRYYTS